jgi:hypothetical protein
MSGQPKPKKNILGLFRFSVGSFLAGLVLLFAAAPFVAHTENGRMLESGLMTMVLISAVLAVGRRRRVLWLAVLMLVPTVIGKWLNHFLPDAVSPVWFFTASLIFIGFIIFQLIQFILLAPRVDSEVMCAGISAYLLLGLLWSFAYMLVACLVPNAFFFDGRIEAATEMTSFTSVYFSFVTLTTVGYGDITPVASVARMLAAAEAMTGTIYVAVFISRLVALYSSQNPGALERKG